MQRSTRKCKGIEITCFQCGLKEYKRHDCTFYKQELERMKKNKKDTIEKKDDVDNNKGKEKENANIALRVIIEGILERT